MADRLIYADKLKAHYAWWKGGSREMTMDEAKSDFDTIIDLQPTVEVEPTKHGRWNKVVHSNNSITHYCSECGSIFNKGCADLGDFNYCPNCGCSMREDDK